MPNLDVDQLSHQIYPLILLAFLLMLLVLMKIIKGRIKLHYDREMAEEQAGFVEGKGTREQIVNIRIIIVKCRIV